MEWVGVTLADCAVVVEMAPTMVTGATEAMVPAEGSVAVPLGTPNPTVANPAFV
jgi:hypothetical protein